MKPKKKTTRYHRSTPTPLAESSLTFVSCRGPNYNAERFGPHQLTGDTSLFSGGPADSLILVHGYNNPQARLEADYSHFAKLLGRKSICYSWPGGDHPLDFVVSVGRATHAGYRLRDMLSMRALAGIQHDVMITHSLGARVALTALLGCATHVDQLIIMAPAVDWNAFEGGAEFEHVSLGAIGEIHVLYSRHDNVLRLAFPLGDATGDHHALGFAGPRKIAGLPKNIHLHDMGHVVTDHGDYLWRPECIGQVKEILSHA